MARFSLWVAALGMVCLIALVTADIDETTPQPNDDEIICRQFMNDGDTMTISRIFDMIAIKLRQYDPDFSSEKLRHYMQFADNDHDDRLNQEECLSLIAYIKNKAPKN